MNNRPPAQSSILVVDDEPSIRDICSQVLGAKGYQVFAVDSAEAALQHLEDSTVDVVLLDNQLPGITGYEVLQRLSVSFPEVEVVMMTAFGNIQTAVRAVKAGAYDFIPKPFEDHEILHHVIRKALERQALVRRSRQAGNDGEIGFGHMIGRSPAIQKIYRTIEQFCQTDSTVLITGESGTGKELVAQAFHLRSLRKSRPFLTVNCAALHENLLESELFGHVRGAFTGASENKKGLFDEANHGTIFLDEVGDMALSTQVKLLRTLQDGEVRPVGSTKSMQVDVRVIAATNRPLEDLMKNGQFREDLFYRLNVINVRIPPLRNRTEDISLLAGYFIEQFTTKYNRGSLQLSPEALDLLEKYNWAGNVRELKHVIECAVVVAAGDLIRPHDLPGRVLSDEMSQAMNITELSQPRPYREAKDDFVSLFTKVYIKNLLSRTNGNVSRAAGLAQMERSNFRRLVEKHVGVPGRKSRAGILKEKI